MEDAPSTAEPSCVLSVRVPISLAHAFHEAMRKRGFKHVSEPMKRFIRKNAQ